MKTARSQARQDLAADDLPQLLASIRGCRLCVETPLRRPLPHEPRPVVRATSSARIAVCGQAPGTRVHASGLPFSDPSGVRLRSWMGVSDDEFYDDSRIAIVPMGFCFPGLDAKGGDLPPRPECAPRWRARVFQHLTALDLVLLVGRYAQIWHLGQAHAGSLSEAVAGWRSALTSSVRPRFIALPHPSWRNNVWLKRNAWFAADLVPRLQQEVRRVLQAAR